MKSIATLMVLSLSLFAFTACESGNTDEESRLLESVLDENNGESESEVLEMPVDDVPFSVGPSSPPPVRDYDALEAEATDTETSE